jgi:hypothetical protein
VKKPGFGYQGDNVMGSGIWLGTRAKALVIGIVSGFAGVAIDIDHIPEYIFNVELGPAFMINGFFDGPQFSGTGRPLHPLVLYLGITAFAFITVLLFQYSMRGTVRSAAKSISTTVQRAINPAPASK